MVPRALKILLWSLVSVTAAVCLIYVSVPRSEPVNSLWLVIASLCVFAVAYRFHSAWLMAKVLTLDDQRATPAYTKEDGKDYVRTNKWVVFGHHFAAIAGPGPLVGPVLAAQFGYLPGTLWILIGATLGGAVHDSVILFASVRRNGKSLGQMVKEEVNPFAGAVCMVSILAILVILIAVLGLVVVKALAHSPWGLFTIVATIPIAMVMGVGLRFGGSRAVLWASAFGVLALLGSVWAGQFVAAHPEWSKAFTLSGPKLAWCIIGYGLAASVLPVWILLAPRDYLSSFMKIGTVAALAVAIIVIAPPLHMPAVTKFIDGTGPVFAGAVFPFVFITIACAAVSGFHALISSGTTPKLLERESGIRTVAYGAMITEMLVGIMALVAACSMSPGQYFAINMAGEPAAVIEQINAAGFPVTDEEMRTLATQIEEPTMYGRTGGAPTFAVGMAIMFHKVFESPLLQPLNAALSGGRQGGHMMALWYHFAIMFEALFILTTIDAGTRVGRFLMQDLLGQVWRPLGRTDSLFANVLASVALVAAWGWFLYQGVIDPLGGINSLWPIFGIANQLLAVIALAFGTTLLLKMGKARYVWVTLLPLCWLFTVTMTAGLTKIFHPAPRIGFLSAANDYRAQLTAGAGVLDEAASDKINHLLVNSYVNTAVTGVFLVLVLLIVAACVREWWLILVRHRKPVLHEAEYTPLDRFAKTED